jgi:uncharacterized protein (TIGR03437 family)
MRKVLVLWMLSGSLIALLPQCPDFSVSPASILPTAVINRPYSAQLSYKGGCAPYSAWEVVSGTALPAGFQFDTATGKLTGTTAAAGNYKLCYKITATGAMSTGCLSLKVNPPITLEPGPFLADGFVGVPWGAWIVKGGADESAGARPYTYKVTSGALPPGVSGHPQGGFLEGAPTEIGDYEFTLQVTCAQGSTATQSYRASIHPPGDFYTSTRKLVFTAMTGSSTQSLPLGVATTDLTPVKFQLAASASTGGAAPAWLRFGATSGETPARIDIQADPKGLAAGKYTARITVTPTGKTVQTVEVEFELRDHVIALNSSPAFLEADIIPKEGQSLQRTATVLVWNEGDGDAAVTASVSSDTPWLTITPAQFTVGAGQVRALAATVDGSKLDYGGWSGSIDLKGPNWSKSIPVEIFRDREKRKGRLYITSNYPTKQGNCSATDTNATQALFTIELANVDEGPINFTAELQGFGDAAELLANSGSLPSYLSKVPLKLVTYPCRIVALGTSTPGWPGGYSLHGLLKVTGSGASNSPYYHTFNITSGTYTRSKTPAEVLGVPSIINEGILFVNTTDELKSMQNEFLINNPDVAPIEFTLGASPGGGANFLAFGVPGGVAPPLSQTAVTVKANAGAFDYGEYSGDGIVQIKSAFGEQALWNVPTTMIVPGTLGSVSGTREGRREAVACVASKLILVPGEPLPFFRHPVDWTAALNARVYDNCAMPVTDATVTASFSTNEPGVSLALSNSAKGLYQATWYPTTANEFLSVTLRAAKAGFAPVSRSIAGSVKANSGDPVVIHYAIVNNLNPVLGASVAPGTVAAIYGFNLATSTEQAQSVPLPRQLGGARVLIGGIEAPLFFSSPGQINVQIPSELAVLDYQSVVVIVDGRYSRPKEIRLTGVNPGIAAYTDGRVIAQHGDYSLVNASSPAKPGEWIVLYLVGMGATDPAVASGARAPSATLASAKVQPKVTIGGAAAEVYFAGLTPGGVGLYQINCKVPADAQTGDLPVVVSQNGLRANPVQIPVKR